METMRAHRKIHTTTVRLPSHVYEQTQKYVQSGKAASINDFILKAIDIKLRMIERKEINAQFAQMANDTNYQQESQLILEQFEVSDAEVLETLDK